MGRVRGAWQVIHHLVFSLSSVIPIFRRGYGEGRKAAGLEIRILSWTAVYSLAVLVASTLLEWIGPQLDLLVTSVLLTAVVFAFILLLIMRSPSLIRESRRKYEGSKLTPGELEIIQERLGTSVPNLSQAVNQGMGVSFSRMINAHRVGEAKRLLSESDMTITSVAFEAGFGSLSSFTSIFKAECGLSPSEFRQKAR
jgi:AraC-like DNA-binding protein